MVVKPEVDIDNVSNLQYLRLVFEVDRVAVAFLEDARVKVVFVLDIQVPASNVSAGKIVSTHFGGLNVPNQSIPTSSILITNSHRGCRDSIYSLKQE